MENVTGSECDHDTICVAGAGAIGITLSAKLSLAGYKVDLVARGESLSTIRRNGIVLQDVEGMHRADVHVGEAHDFGVQRLVFLCPKSHDLPDLATAVQPLIGCQTVIVPMINGIPWWLFEPTDSRQVDLVIRAVDPDGRLRSLLPSPQVIGTTAMITAERLGPGIATTSNKLHMTIGELDDRRTKRLEKLQRVLNRSGVTTSIASRIRDAVWTKVARNMISNPVTAITGATLSQNFGNSYLANVSKRMLEEIEPVVHAYGSKLEIDATTIIASGRGMGAVKTSMLQDLESGRRLELASICDAVLELAKAKNLAMPVTETITGLAHFMDKERKARAA